MYYANKAAVAHPAYLIFLIDSSLSMQKVHLGSRTRMQVIWEALQAVLKELGKRGVKATGGIPVIRPRFHVAVLSYNDVVRDMTGGFAPIGSVIQKNPDQPAAAGNTNTRLAFEEARKLIMNLLPRLDPLSPAPLICHLTDGAYNVGGDPSDVVNEIKAMGNADGPVLVESIFVTNDALRQPIGDLRQWPGLRRADELKDAYAAQLFAMSSPIPEKYMEAIQMAGFDNMQPGARLMFSGTSPELITQALMASGSSGTDTAESMG